MISAPQGTPVVQGYHRAVRRYASIYDGLADYDDAFVAEDRGGVIALATETVVRLLGRGQGRCLDRGVTSPELRDRYRLALAFTRP